MNTSPSELINQLMPPIHADLIGRLGLHPFTDLSHSNQCHNLTGDLHQALANRGITVRRELHISSSGAWHYVIAHAEPNTPPSEEDVITDLNPWQFTSDRRYTGHLHDKRSAVQAILAEAGAPPESFVSLRGLATIVRAHTESRNPYRTHNLR